MSVYSCKPPSKTRTSAILHFSKISRGKCVPANISIYSVLNRNKRQKNPNVETNFNGILLT